MSNYAQTPQQIAKAVADTRGLHFVERTRIEAMIVEGIQADRAQAWLPAPVVTLADWNESEPDEEQDPADQASYWRESYDEHSVFL